MREFTRDLKSQKGVSERTEGSRAMVQNSVLDDDRKFLTLTLVLPVLLFSVSLLLSYSCNHTTTTAPPQTNLTETTEDSKTEMETITPPTITTTSPSTSTTSSTVEMIVGGVKIEKNPSESKLAQLGVSSWPKYASYLPLSFPIVPFSSFCSLQFSFCHYFLLLACYLYL